MKTLILILYLVVINSCMQGQTFFNESVPPVLERVRLPNLYSGFNNKIHLFGYSDTRIRQSLETYTEKKVIYYATIDSNKISNISTIPDTFYTDNQFTGGSYDQSTYDISISNTDFVNIIWNKYVINWLDYGYPKYKTPSSYFAVKRAGIFEKSPIKIDSSFNPKICLDKSGSVHFVWESVSPLSSPSDYYKYSSIVKYGKLNTINNSIQSNIIGKGFSPKILIDKSDSVHIVILEADSSVSVQFSLKYTKGMLNNFTSPIVIKKYIYAPKDFECQINSLGTIHVGWREQYSSSNSKIFSALIFNRDSVVIDSSSISNVSDVQFKFAESGIVFCAARFIADREYVYFSRSDEGLFKTNKLFSRGFYDITNPLLLLSNDAHPMIVFYHYGVKYILTDLNNYLDSAIAVVKSAVYPYGIFNHALVDNKGQVWISYGKNPQGNPYDYETKITAFKGLPTGIRTENKDNLQLVFTLFQNYPNPFNSSTVINYELAQASNITIKIYDLLGREIDELVNDKQDHGLHTVRFDANNLSSGIYFYRLQSDKYMQSRKLVILK